MPPASATRPIRPSSASISRTRWPLPSPPIAGLQDIAPMVANRWVTSAVLRAHARRRGRRLAAGMAAADDDHIEAAVHRQSPKGSPVYQGRIAGSKMRGTNCRFT